MKQFQWIFLTALLLTGCVMPTIQLAAPAAGTVPTASSIEVVPATMGAWTALVDPEQGSLQIADANGKTTTVFPPGSTVGEVSWSPDGRQLLVVRRNWETSELGTNDVAVEPIALWQVKVTERAIEEPQLLFQALEMPDNDGNYGPQQIVFGLWSPDSRYVVISVGILSVSVLSDGLPAYVINTETGQAAKLAESKLTNPAYQSWAADSSALIFTAGGYRSAQVGKWLSLYDTATNTVTTVISSGVQVPGMVAWNLRGDLIAYAAVPAEQTGSDLADWMSFDNPAIAGRRIYLLDPKMQEFQRLNDRDEFQDAPVWSKDSATLIYVQRVGDQVGWAQTQISSGATQIVTDTLRPLAEMESYYGQFDWTALLGAPPVVWIE